MIAFLQKQRVFGNAPVRGLLIAGSVIGLALVCAAYSPWHGTAPLVSNSGAFAASASVPESVRSAEMLLTGTAQTDVGGESVIVDHTCTDITTVPQVWIERAKDDLHIGYGHTSHGGQLTGGMAGLIEFANGGGLGLSLPTDIFQFSPSSNDGGDYLHLFEGAGWSEGYLGGDVGYYPGWVDETRAYLGTPDPVTGRGTNHPEMNVIIWSWCGQASSYTEQQMLEQYLLPMSELEADYPGVTFVYMTGHADGTGEEGNLHQRNQQIRDYCIQNDKVLYDFYDIELFDPDGNYYGDKAVNDQCDYDSNGDGIPDRIWCLDWQNAHIEGVDWYACDCPHSYPINCNQKAYAAWWLWARLAGWEGGAQAGPEKTVSSETAATGETVTYTVTVRDFGAPPDAFIYLADEVPVGLSYVAGSIRSTAGVVDAEDAPILRWTGVLSSTPFITVSYAVTVDTIESREITNSAVISSTGYDPVTVSATLTTEAPEQADLTPSYKKVYPLSGDLGDQIDYRVVVRSSTGPVNHTFWLTDTVPDGLAYLPGTLTSTSGQVSDASVPALYWSGTLSPTAVVTISYTATVATTDRGYVSNDALVGSHASHTITRTATILANPYRAYMPLVFRDG